ncbi:DUF5686 and carboxypeptidase regulatory-like domain-containing protein [Maribellus sp. YY47]|uniref:DUF5686 and carboxypeptidase regulatory-like domain-containing protein n=1 Tax=Maribellus sp. YY47 TaxID=2929486 RepID=UPI002000D976|nr:DUF5686 and carboxypeptidase regulatory-like domain-containing protein [Maribellus sp. YY47]MCK3684910.1 DUF5686 and carboxypeptidase regulatory-like domain-containing protein [Maribellus sp. YY47]
MKTANVIPSFNWTLLIVLILLFSTFHILSVKAQVIAGKITDEQNMPVPYATIFISETKEGTTSNIDGNFELQLPKGSYHFTIRSMGYLQQNKQITLDRDSLFLPVTLHVQKFELKEIKIFPGKEDPAYLIMRKAIAKAPYYRDRIKHYTADLYIKSNFEFQNIPKIIKQQEMEDGRKFKDYFKENVTYVIESHNKITYDYPNSYKQEVISKRTSLTGIDEPPVMGLMTETFYQERPADVISPLAPMALRHYNFMYEGFITVGDFDVFKIRVTPKRKSDELVDGYIYIVDQLWCIYNLDFSSTIKFVEYRIKQQFENLGNENWLPVTHHLTGNFGALGMRGNFYYGASVKYDSIIDNYTSKVLPEAAEIDTDKVETVAEKQENENIKQMRREMESLTQKEHMSNADVRKAARLNREITKEQFKEMETTSYFQSYDIEDKKTAAVREEAWDSIRTIPLTPAEVQSYKMADSIQSLQDMRRDTSATGTQSRFFKTLLTGSFDLTTDSLTRLRYRGLIDLKNFDYNAVDGYKYMQYARLRYYPDSAQTISIEGQLGYAFNRKTLFGNFGTSFENVFAKQNRVNFSVGKESRDLKGLNYGITPIVNAASSFFFAKNYMRLYETGFVTLSAFQRINKKLSLHADASYNHFYPLSNHASFPLGDNKHFDPNVPAGYEGDSPFLTEQKSFSYSAGATYRKRIRKPWAQQSPFLFMSDFYRIDLNFYQGVKDVFSSVSDFSRIDLKFQHQANVSISTGIDWSINAGYFLNADQLHFSQFKHFNTSNIAVSMKSFTGMMQLINDYEFSTNDSYLNGTFELRSEYILLRYLSLINKKAWSESLHFNYLTTPALHNYWELGYSLNNFFFVGNLGVFTGFEGGEFKSVGFKFSLSLAD